MNTAELLSKEREALNAYLSAPEETEAAEAWQAYLEAVANREAADE